MTYAHVLILAERRPRRPHARDYSALAYIRRAERATAVPAAERLEKQPGERHRGSS